MFAKKTYRQSRWMERIVHVAGVPSTDPEFPEDCNWYTVRPEYIVEIQVSTTQGRTEWRKIKLMRMKRPIAFLVVTEQNNWIETMWVHRKAFRVTLQDEC